MNSEDWAIVQNEALLQSESGAQETWEDANADDLDVARDHSAPSSSRGGHENALKLSRKLFSPLDIHVRRLADRATSRNGGHKSPFDLEKLASSSPAGFKSTPTAVQNAHLHPPPTSSPSRRELQSYMGTPFSSVGGFQDSAQSLMSFPCSEIDLADTQPNKAHTSNRPKYQSTPGSFQFKSDFALGTNVMSPSNCNSSPFRSENDPPLQVEAVVLQYDAHPQEHSDTNHDSSPLCEAEMAPLFPNRTGKRRKLVSVDRELEMSFVERLELAKDDNPSAEDAGGPKGLGIRQGDQSNEKQSNEFRIKSASEFLEPPVRGAYKIATREDGVLLYLPFNKLQECCTKLKRKKDADMRINLLATPVHRLLDEIESDTIAESIEQSRLKLSKIKADKKKRSKKSDRQRSASLWVDKYRPETFVDLMSDDWLNRELLQWIKQWDHCVFGTNLKPNFSEKKSLDAFLRPEKRIILLHGPPGLGKTTLAHVIAKQCGYNIVEVNASDDRTSEVLKSKVLSAIEMQPVFGDRKPNLVIIDEIDGVSSAAGGSSDHSFIKILVSLAAEENSANNGSSSNWEASKARKSKLNKSRTLMRPIICICNDLYAPVLKPLKTVAQVLHFRKPLVSTISQRLKRICDIEGLKSEGGVRPLALLCEKADCDIRTCLNTLQFLKEKYASVSVQMIESISIGQKDQHKSLFAVWETVFRTIEQKKLKATRGLDTCGRSREATMYGIGEGGDGEVGRFVTRVSNCISGGVEYEKVMQGCFENYLNIKFHDSNSYGQNIVHLHEYINFYDLLNKTMNSNSYQGVQYIPFALTAFHRFCAQNGKATIEWPRQDYEMFLRRKELASILSAMNSQVSPATRKWFGSQHSAQSNSGSIVTTELISPLLKIMSPKLRPVNHQLLKPAERETLGRLVNVMLEFGLTYLQEKLPEIQTSVGMGPSGWTYRLEPPLERLLSYGQTQLKSLLPVSYAVRQMIAREIELEKLRRVDLRLAQNRPEEPKKPNNRAIVDLKSLLAPAKIKEKIVDKVARDFFGRPIEVTSGSGVDQPDTSEKDCIKGKTQPHTDQKIWYKYHEGFSNAVRKTLLVEHLKYPWKGQRYPPTH